MCGIGSVVNCSEGLREAANAESCGNLRRARHNCAMLRPSVVAKHMVRAGAILASTRCGLQGVRRSQVHIAQDQTAMDASLYFRLTDRIDGAGSLEELAAIEAEIDHTQPHMMERRALERRMNRRERALSGAAM